MQSLSQNVYEEVLQVWVGNTEHDDFNIGCELFDTVESVFQSLDDIGIKNSSFKLLPQIATHGLTLFPIFAILV